MLSGWGARLGAAIRSSGLSRDEIASAISREKSALSHYVAERRNPDVGTLAKLCITLGISADWLLGVGAEIDVAEASATYGEAQLEQARREIRTLRDRLAKIAKALDDPVAGDGAVGNPPKAGRRKLR